MDKGAMIEMQREQCIVPFDFENGEYGGVKKDSWSEKIRADNEAMTLLDPEYVQNRVVEVQPVQENTNNSNPYFYGQNNLGNNATSSTVYGVVTTTQNDKKESEYDYYAYTSQNGKNKSNDEYAVIRDKNKEKIIVTHAFCERGFARVKRFSDESWDRHIIACGRIEQVQHWLINGTEYVRLLISDTTPSYIVREAEWTNVFEFSELEKNKFVEGL